MKCLIVKSMLSAYMDGEISEPAKAFVEKHLDVCNRCTQEMEGLKTVQSMLRNTRQHEPNDYLAERILHSVHSCSDSPSTISRYTFSIHKTWSSNVMAFVGVGAVLVASFWLYDDNSDHVQPIHWRNVAVVSQNSTPFEYRSRPQFNGFRQAGDTQVQTVSLQIMHATQPAMPIEPFLSPISLPKQKR